MSHSSRSPKSDVGRQPPHKGGDGEDTVIMHGGSRLRHGEHNTPTTELSGGLLQSLLDSLSDGLAAVDASGKFVQFNPAGEAIIGKGAVGGPPETWSKAYGLYLPDGTTPFPANELPLVRALQGERTPEVEMFVRNE